MTKTKIRGVDIEVCAAEQVIAYNIAFYWHDTIKDVSQVVRAAREQIESYKFDRYDKAAILTALRNGYEAYIERKYHIIMNYEEIGEVFKLKEQGE